MRTAQSHSFSFPVVREIPPSSIGPEPVARSQRELVTASLLARP
jgi:hypothetical protein